MPLTYLFVVGWTFAGQRETRRGATTHAPATELQITTPHAQHWCVSNESFSTPVLTERDGTLHPRAHRVVVAQAVQQVVAELAHAHVLGLHGVHVASVAELTTRVVAPAILHPHDGAYEWSHRAVVGVMEHMIGRTMKPSSITATP